MYKKKIIRIYYTLSLLILFLLINTSASIQQAVHSQLINLGQPGSATVCTVCNVDTSNKKVSFNSYGKYSIKNRTGYSIVLKSRSYKQSNKDLKMTFTFYTIDVNTHVRSKDTTYTYVITYNSIKDKVGK